MACTTFIKQANNQRNILIAAEAGFHITIEGITCCAALVSPRTDNVIVEMSHVFICSR